MDGDVLNSSDVVFILKRGDKKLQILLYLDIVVFIN